MQTLLNITSTLVFTIVFEIHCNFYCFYLIDGKFTDLMLFPFLQGKIWASEKSDVFFRGFAHPIGIGHAIRPGLQLL